jgi:hypothetical protein
VDAMDAHLDVRDCQNNNLNSRNDSFRKHLVVWQDDQLFYIGQECTTIPSALGECYGANAKRLDLSFNCLKTLKGLEKYSALEDLILDNNQLGDSAIFPYLPKVNTLSLNKNKIKDLESLLDKISNFLPSLCYLSLLGNAACPDQLSNIDKDEEDYQKYRLFVIHRLPRLKFLDSRMVTKSEWREAKRVGAFMKVARPITTNRDHDYDDDEDTEPDNDGFRRYTPLPPTPLSKDGKHKGAYGVCRYKYLGLHSEGNRFIRNCDL